MSDTAVQVAPAPYGKTYSFGRLSLGHEGARWEPQGHAHNSSSHQSIVRAMTKKTAIYRHFDNEGRLLYVGISLDPLKRTSDHMQRAYWADRIRSIRIEWLATRGAAVDAEERAIATERPLYNLAGRPEATEVEIDEGLEMEKMERYLGGGRTSAESH